MMSLITLPDTTTMLTTLHAPAQGIFNDLLPIVYFVIGMFIGGFLISVIIGAVITTIGNIFHKPTDQDRLDYEQHLIDVGLHKRF